MSDLSRQIGNLSPAQKQLLERLLKREAGGDVRADGIARRGAKRAPLSFAQRRLWVLDQLEPGGTAFNSPVACRLTGPLDAAVLERSFDEIVRRHETLRTTFAVEGGEPVQVIHEPRPLALPVESLEHLDEGEREAEARRLWAAEARCTFDLAAGPLFRLRLLRLAPREHILLLTWHHIITDGWSYGVLMGELTRLYHAYAHGLPSPLAELPIQYADFAAWQHERLPGEALERLIDYWRQRLAQTPALDLPTDRPRPAVRGERAERQPFALPEDLSTSLRELCRAENVTLFMLLHAAFQLLLSRYAGQTDFAVGADIAGRRPAETEGLIGFFVNQLALRTDLSGDPTFRELLGRVRETCLAAYTHQELPFDQIVQELKPERAANRHPLFQVKLVVQNVPLTGAGSDELRVEPLEMRDRTPRLLDLTLFVWERAQIIEGRLLYDTDLFDAATVESLAERFLVLLKGIAADPDEKVSSLPLLTPAEERRVLVEWNEPRAKYPAARRVRQLFEEQVARTPDAVALAFGDERFTYRELNGRANQLAHRLMGLGVGPDVVVGLCVERSLEMVVALLGVLKAGGAYLPLDPSYPLERLSFMLEDAAASVLLTLERLEASLPTYWGQTVYLDGEEDELARRGVENPTHETDDDHLAYVIYTSGSTGGPKGVMVSHGALANYLQWCARNYFGADGAGSLVHSPLGFDLTVTSLLAPLCVGRSVTLLPDRADIEALASALRVGGYALVKLTPAHLAALGRLLTPEEAARAARAFIVGGEALVWEALRFWREAAPATRLVNEYGPTEATVGCCVYEVAGEALAAGPIPIGRSIFRTRLYVLDGRGRPCPVGVPGELYVGGAGLARGYLNRPALTAERFVPNPYSVEPGARLYKTGDVARHLPTGELEYIGRIDEQLKIRGYRIEPGEVEAALRRHGQVRDCVVVGLADPAGGQRLVAYVVARGGAAPSAAELREHLTRLLPEHMVPSLFVPLEELPLTANGKVDRGRLPPPSEARPAAEYVAPRTPAEELVAEVWAQVLGVERVGVFDNFFDLGGHSLLAVQVLSRLRSLFQKELTVPMIFDAPTVARVVEVLKEDEARPGQIEKVAATLKRLAAMSSEEVRALLQDAG